MRGKKEVVDTETFIKKSKELFPGMFTYEKTEYHGYRNPITITCKKHGDFTVNVCDHISTKNKYRCMPYMF